MAKTHKQIEKEIEKIESQPIWSSVDQGRWEGLVWALGEKREYPWKQGDYYDGR